MLWGKLLRGSTMNYWESKGWFFIKDHSTWWDDYQTHGQGD